MSLLALIPTQAEYDLFIHHCSEMGLDLQKQQIGRLEVSKSEPLNLTLAMGELGKNQFGIHTQHLIENGPAWRLVTCAGAAGGLSYSIDIGDVVLGTCTVEHDIYNGFGPPIIPEYIGDQTALENAAQLNKLIAPNKLHFGRIASGDEDVMGSKRKQEILARTDSLVVAWEGAGGARVCRFFDIPFIEIRGMSDYADSDAPEAFEENLPLVMQNIAKVVIGLATRLKTIGW